jgi:hypothetical protein
MISHSERWLSVTTRRCGCGFIEGVMVKANPAGCLTHGVGNPDTFPRRYDFSRGRSAMYAARNRDGFAPNSVTRPKGLDRVWTPHSGGTI